MLLHLRGAAVEGWERSNDIPLNIRPLQGKRKSAEVVLKRTDLVSQGPLILPPNRFWNRQSQASHAPVPSPCSSNYQGFPH